MKVAYIVTRADSFGGAQAHVLDLAQALRAGGGEPVVLAGGDGPFAAELRRRHVPCIEIRHLVRPVHPVRDALAFLEILVDKNAKALAVNWGDEIVKATALTRDGAVIHPSFAPKSAA